MSAAATLDARIDLGVAWLDEHAPGWLDRVDETRLDDSDHHCLLGQVFHDAAFARTGWHAGLHLVGGFDAARSRGFLGYNLGENRPLTAAWAARIDQLRHERAAS